MAGGYEFQPPYEQMLAAELRKLQNQIDALRKGLVGLGIQIDPNGNLIFDGTRGDLNITNGGSLNVDGSLAVGGTETVGGTLHVTGNTIIDGTLSLPAGIIGNAALANPAAFAVANGTTAGITFSATVSTRTETIAVPSGFSRALVMAIAACVCDATGLPSRVAGW